MSIPDTHTEDSNNKSSTANICDCIGMRESKLETHSENAHKKNNKTVYAVTHRSVGDPYSDIVPVPTVVHVVLIPG